jgi:hypothetical protein
VGLGRGAAWGVGSPSRALGRDEYLTQQSAFEAVGAYSGGLIDIEGGRAVSHPQLVVFG